MDGRIGNHFSSSKGNARTIYPACYVYRIDENDESTANHKNILENKKSSLSTTKQSNPTTISTSFDTTPNTNKIERLLIKKMSNRLLISSQQNSCVEIETK